VRVGLYRDREEKLFCVVAALASFQFSDEEANLLRRAVHGQVVGQAAYSIFGAAEKSAFDTNRD
jgi:hypothetical protein